MKYFPLFHNTADLRVLIVGAGEVATRKTELMLKTDATITVVAPWQCDSMLGYVNEERVTLHSREFNPADLTGQQLVFVATDDHQLNCDISTLCKAANIPVNVVDSTELCSFITPSIVDRDPLVVALSSGGSAPVLLRLLRQKLEALLPARLADLARLSDRFRDKVKQRFSSINQRRHFWEQVLEGDIAETALRGELDSAAQQIEARLASNADMPAGCVYLVGAGPGDPELLTFKALRLMQKADVVVYDRLVSAEILELVRRDSEKIYVGKKASLHSVPQDQINQLLVDLARAGKRVVRLKGGDPYIFGRGGEEVQSLLEAGISFDVVPGITAAAGAAAYAGIPLTHRDHAQSVTLATAHLKDDSVDLDWPALAKSNQTLVFYMGLTALPVICRELQQHGLAADTQIALVQSATTAKQQVVTGTLGDIEARAAEANILPPALIIVGGVVSLYQTFNAGRLGAQQ